MHRPTTRYSESRRERGAGPWIRFPGDGYCASQRTASGLTLVYSSLFARRSVWGSNPVTTGCSVNIAQSTWCCLLLSLSQND
jgi:hypothetical protein